MQSSKEGQVQRGLHVAIIMDGNGRWAKARGLPREAGHHAGIAALREVSEAAAGLGVGTLTVYAFSVDNWRRPASEVSALMGILRRYLETELARFVVADIRLTVIGRRDRLPDGLAELIDHAERVSAEGKALNLRVAIDYSGRDAIVAAAAGCGAGEVSREALSRGLAEGAGGPDVDLLIRTSGEQRLSDFLLWEAAYAELYFTERTWPDFGTEDLALALAEFRARDRRFGGLSAAPEAAAPVAASPPPVPVTVASTAAARRPCRGMWATLLGIG
jgi:undecaprenyl diphosphate synthase